MHCCAASLVRAPGTFCDVCEQGPSRRFEYLTEIVGRPLDLNGKYFDSSYHKNKKAYFGGVRNLAVSVPSLSPLPSSPLRPTKDDLLPRNKTESNISLNSTPPKNESSQNNSTFSLEEITQPDGSATYNPSSHFSHIPSDIPSFVPSQSSSDELSNIPSDLPSLAPSDAPSLTPTQLHNSNISRRPSYAPTSQPFNEFEIIAAPVSVPVPTLIPSAIPSRDYPKSSTSVPTQVKNNRPSTEGSATPSEEYFFQSSAVPSSVRSNTPSATGSVTATPSVVSSESRTPRPSQSVTSRPSTSPVKASSTGVPSLFTQADTPNQDAAIHSTIQLLELATSTDSELSEDDVNMFQTICKSEFLATFLPRTHEANYNKIDCMILSQSIDKHSERQDEREPGEFLLSILLQVRSEVQLPDSVAFSHIVSLTFQNFSEELQLSLESMADFSSVHASDKGPIVTEIQGGINPPSNNGGITTTTLVGALLGGAVLALVVSGLILYRSRRAWGTGAYNTPSGDDARQSRFTSSSVRSVPRVIGFTMDSTAFEKGRASSPKSVSSEDSCNIEDLAKNLNVDCQSRTNSAEKTEGSGSLDSSLHGLDLLQSSVSSGESKLPEGKRLARMKFNARRRKSEDNSYKPKVAQMLNALGSDDASTDLECGIDLTSKPHAENRMDESVKVMPSDDCMQGSETPEGESILQMHLDDLAHTGEVLNDLGQFEEQWHDRLTRVRVSASAETPRQANTQYRRPPRSRSMIFSSMSNDVLSEFTDAESL